MTMTLKQVRAFVAVAQTGSFAEACDIVFLSQPAISVAIRNLEEIVGGRLLARSTRRVELTPEGQHFLPVALRLLADWGQATDDLSRLFGMGRGSLSVAVMPSFASNGFPRGLASFRRAYPGIDIRVQDIVMEAVIDEVRNGRADIGITFESGKAEAVDFIPLFTDASLAIVASDHALAGRRRCSWKDLAKYSFVTMNQGSAYRGWIDAAQHQADAIPTDMLEANQLGTILRMVEVGLGVSVVPALGIPAGGLAGVVSMPLAKPGIERRVGIYLKRRQQLSVAATHMIDVLRAEFSTPTAGTVY